MYQTRWLTFLKLTLDFQVQMRKLTKVKCQTYKCFFINQQLKTYFTERKISMEDIEFDHRNKCFVIRKVVKIIIYYRVAYH